jgi:hypothetical protein
MSTGLRTSGGFTPAGGTDGRVVEGRSALGGRVGCFGALGPRGASTCGRVPDGRPSFEPTPIGAVGRTGLEGAVGRGFGSALGVTMGALGVRGGCATGARGGATSGARGGCAVGPRCAGALPRFGAADGVLPRLGAGEALGAGIFGPLGARAGICGAACCAGRPPKPPPSRPPGFMSCIASAVAGDASIAAARSAAASCVAPGRLKGTRESVERDAALSAGLGRRMAVLSIRRGPRGVLT